MIASRLLCSHAMRGNEGSVQLKHVLPAMGWVANEALTARVDDKVQIFEWNLSNQYGHRIRYLHYVGRALAPLDR